MEMGKKWLDMEVCWKSFYSIYIGVLPLIMYYKFPFVSSGFGSALSLLFLPYVIVSLFKAGNFEFNKRNPFIVLYFVYLIVQSTNDSMVVFLLFIAFFHILASKKSIDYALLKKIIVGVSVISSIAIVIQRLFSIVGIHVSFFFNSLTTSDFHEVSSVLVGNNLIRFSGFFAEPSHFAEYALIGLILAIIRKGNENGEKMDYYSIIIISLGILFSTSGIGILGMFGILGYYVLFSTQKLKNVPFLLRIIILLTFFMLVLVVLYQIPSVKMSFLRVFGSVDGYNAVDGRSVYNQIYIDKLVGSEKIWGVGATNFENYLVAYVKILYQYGCVGISLLFLSMLYFIVKGNKIVKIVCLLYTLFLFATGLIGFLNYIFYMSVMSVLFYDEKMSEHIVIVKMLKNEFEGEKGVTI